MILAIETSVERVGVAVGDAGGARALAMLASDRRHAESLVPMISFVLAQAGLTVADLDHIAVDVGPGLFTGMRVGMSTAQSMAWALELPVVPVCSLDVIAHGAGATETNTAVALDARRGEVYWALYRAGSGQGDPVRLREPAVTNPEDCAIAIADRGEEILCAGTGFVRHHELFSAVPSVVQAPVSLAMPRAEDLLSLAVLRAARDRVVAPDAVEPEYLRAPDAEINWQTRGGAQ